MGAHMSAKSYQNPTPPGAHLFSPEKQSFTTAEAAQYIGRHVNTIRTHVYNGNIKPKSYGGVLDNRYWYFDRDDLDHLYAYHCYQDMDKR